MPKIDSLEFQNISKSFHGHKANDRISFKVNKGEILGLLGENGAGKTTLMNILFGLYQSDEGSILINNSPTSFRNPREAIEKGIGMVHQHFMLVDAHSVGENIALSLPQAPFWFPESKLREKILQSAEEIGLTIDPDQKIYQLSAGEQQRVEILKALIQGVDLLILDEPTSVLTPQESKQLFQFIQRMKSLGKTIIIITHKMDEILEICNRVVVLRKGRMEGEADPKSMTKKELARWMVGREVGLKIERKALKPGDNILEVMDLEVANDRGLRAVKGMSLALHKNEILGIAGVSGNGQRELVEAITGLRKSQHGSIILQGRDITYESARVKSNLGIAHIPEERIKFGIVPNLLIHENSVLKKHHNTPFSNVLFLDYHKIHQHAEELVEEFQISTPNMKTPMKNLSGGNIQKLILGREIKANPSLLVASHPTYGLDVGATEYVRHQLIQVRDQGGAVLLVSEDLEEVMALSDRILVMYEGQISGEILPGQSSLEEIGLLMSGHEGKSHE